MAIDHALLATSAAYDVARLIAEQQPQDLISALEVGGAITPVPDRLSALAHSRRDLERRGNLTDVHPDDVLIVTDAFVRVAFGRAGSSEVQVRLIDPLSGLASVHAMLFADLLNDPEICAVIVRTRRVAGAPTEQVTSRRAEQGWRRARGSITFHIDHGGHILDVVGPLQEALGWSAAAAIGQRTRAFIHPDDQAHAVQAVVDVIQHPGASAIVRHRLVRRDGTYAWYEAELRAVATDDPDVRFTAECRDVSEQVELRERLEWQAGHDLLTGLLNRRDLMKQLAALLGESANSGWTAAIYIDLDDFKDVNDSLGHEVGDRFIVELSRRLERDLRPGDLLSRLGGDEFLLVCPGLDSASAADLIAARIHQRVSDPIELDGIRLRATASLGVALHDGVGDASALVRDADTAMYEAKRRGRNRTVQFDAELHDALLARVLLLGELREALVIDDSSVDDQLTVSYHTIRDARCETTIRGVEALVRWNHPRLGLLSPDAFLPIAVQARILPELDHWVFRRAMRDIKPLIDRCDVDEFFRLGVNLSGATLSRPDCVELLFAEIEAAGFDPARLVVEVTESEVIESLSKAELAIGRIRERGILIALDDFGVGYSSLTYLRRLTANYLKLDHTFVREITTDSDVAFIIEAVVTMATRLGIFVIAEGIETLEQLDRARELGVTSVQGYRWGAPVGVDDLPFRPRTSG